MLPTELHFLVAMYAWGFHTVTVRRPPGFSLLEECDYLIANRGRIPRGFLSPVVRNLAGQCVCNPMREDMPFYPTELLDWQAPVSSPVCSFFEAMRPSLFKEVRTYCGVFKKYLHKFCFAVGRTQFEDRWNWVMTRFLYHHAFANPDHYCIAGDVQRTEFISQVLVDLKSCGWLSPWRRR